MTLWGVFWKSLLNRKLTSCLTVLSISLSVLLLLGIERIRLGARESFSNTISQTDLIVGARGGQLQLLLYAVFNMGSANANMGFDTFQKIKQHPAVEWAIPYSLGDSHRGFRVVGTNDDFYRFYRFGRARALSFAAGQEPKRLFDVVLGAEVARSLGYQLGTSIAMAHGIHDGPAIYSHDDKPFTVSGILNRTGTPIDRSLYISLQGLEAMHLDWSDGAPPRRGEETPADSIQTQDLDIEQISAAFVRTKNRIETMGLQRELNTYADEALLAIIPGVVLGELWSVVSYAEDGLRLVSWAVLVVGLLSMLIALYTSLQERRREMAILRSVGAGLPQILMLLLAEAVSLTFFGVVVGAALTYALLLGLQPLLETSLGLFVPITALRPVELLYMMLILSAGLLIGLIPALKAYRNSLADGLAVRLLLPFGLFLSAPLQVEASNIDVAVSAEAAAEQNEAANSTDAPQDKASKAVPVKPPLIIASSIGWLREVAREVTCDGQGVELTDPIVPAGSDPHRYKLTPKSRLVWSKAQLRLIIGEGFEPWSDKSSGSAGQLFVATKNVNLRPLEVDDHDHDEKMEGRVHARPVGVSRLDPHIWHSPAKTREVALNFYNFIVKKASHMRAPWDACLRAFVQRTKVSERAIHEKIATVPSSRRVLATNHDSMGYFANAFGLKVIAIAGVSTEAQLTPGQLKRAIDGIKKMGVKAVFLDVSTPPELVKRVAAEAAVKVGGELYADGLAASGDSAGTITGLWETNAETIVKALKP
jgi:putative ABC transport system permease protein